MSSVWFTSDLHFFHRGILKFEPERRPFDSVEEHNEVIVDRWNKNIRKKDHVWCLGDVCFGPKENLQIFNRLNGTKHLVLGNHDKFGVREYIKYFNRVEGFFSKYGWWISHCPIYPSEFFRKPVNIHGHLHSRELDDLRYINVGLENWNLEPVHMDTIRELIKGRGIN